MKIYLEILLLIIAIVFLICLFIFFAKTALSPTPNQESLGSVCIGEKCFSVELAKTEAQRERGLMYKNELDKNKGMLFIFDKEAIYPFWMKNTLIPLDMIWIDSNNEVVFFSQNLQPCKTLICPSIIPPVKAKYVLEINAGICQKIGLELGDELNIRY